jgi:quinolinate synthase
MAEVSGTTTGREKPAATRLARTGKFAPIAPPDLEYTDAVARATAHLYDKVKDVIPAIEWPVMAPYVKAINDLKKVRNAVILAHNYQTPEIFHCVADIIVQCGVHFMAETSKLLNPDKLVLIPDMRAGCSLAASITGGDVRLLRERYPGVPVVTYVNTSADVKAESDICCTSSNAVEVVESLGADRVIFLPDRYLANWVASQTRVKIIAWTGACEVHERFTGKEIHSYREAHPGVVVLAHPECPPDVIAEADYTGSTSKMTSWVLDKRPARVLLVTECSMSSNIEAEAPGIEFIRPCNLCPHMKRITLPKILDSLVELKDEVTVDPLVAAKARRAVERMINLRS